MGASIWEGSTTIVSTANADNTFKGQRFVVATAGQTVFTLTSFAYQTGTASLEVFINGVAQYIGVDFTETSNTVVTLTSGAEVGDIVVIRGFVGGTAAQAAEVSAAQAANSAALAYQYYQWTLALSPASLPLSIANGGTGQITKAAAFLALAPTPVAGKVIGSTDGTTFTMVDAFRVGAQSTSGSVTLTASSNQVQSFSPTAPGQYATLPDATTLLTQGAAFVIENRGDFDYGVKDGAGNKLGWIRPKTSAIVALKDNSTAAGGWFIINGEKTGVTAKFSSTGTVDITALISVPLDANRIMLISGTWNSTSNAGAIAVVYDQSTQTWGTPVTVAAQLGNAGGVVSPSSPVAVLQTTNQVLFCYLDGANSSNITARVLSVSGTTITANTAASVASNADKMYNVTAVGTAFALTYVVSGQSLVRAISVSGTTPTISASALSLSAAGTQYTVEVFAVTSSVALIVTSVSSGTVCLPVTFSGSSTPVAGTGVTVTGTQKCRILPMASGRFIVAAYSGGNYNCSLISISGTTATQSAITPLTINSPGAESYSEIMAISATKALVIAVNSANTALVACNLVDTAGTLSSAGTLTLYTQSTVIETLTAKAFSIICSALNGNNVAYGALATKTTGAAPGLTEFYHGIIDVSGTVPTVVQPVRAIREGVNLRVIEGFATGTSNLSPSITPVNTFETGVRDPKSLITGFVTYPFPTARSDYPYQYRFSYGGGYERFNPPVSGGFSTDQCSFAKGFAANDSFMCSPQASANAGFQLQLVEVAA